MNLAHFLLFLRFLFYVNRYFTRTCVCVPCACLITSTPMELEIWTVVSYNMDASHLEKQSALLPTELSLQPSFFTFHMCSCFCACTCMWRSRCKSWLSSSKWDPGIRLSGLVALFPLSHLASFLFIILFPIILSFYP